MCTQSHYRDSFPIWGKKGESTGSHEENNSILGLVFLNTFRVGVRLVVVMVEDRVSQGITVGN